MQSQLKSVDDPSAWRGTDFKSPDEWTYLLSPDDVEEIAQQVKRCRDAGLRLATITRHEFALPRLQARIERWADEINCGRGFVLVRGIPPDRFNDDECRMAFWGIGLYLGVPISQNSYGDMLGDVFDQGVKMGTGRVRGYRTNQSLLFHTDRCDIVGLLCLRRARSGGLSSLVSSTRVYRELALHHAEYLRPLHEGYWHASMEEGGELTKRRIPVFDVRDGVVSCRIQRNTVENGRKMGYAEYDALETAALACFDELVSRPDLRLDMMLERGDMQFINNYTTLHARTEFEDDPDPSRRRHMVRLWLRSHGDARPVDRAIFNYYEGVEATLETGAH